MTAPGGYVPVIDLGLVRPSGPAGRLTTAAAVDQAFQASGFLVAVGHGVRPATVSVLYDAGRRFFSQDEAARSEAYADPLDPLQRGYSPDDRLQMFSANRLGEPVAADEALFAPNRWPALPGFRDGYLAYYRAAEALALEFMRLCAVALGLPEKWFDSKFSHHMSPLTVNYYPARPDAGPGVRLRNEPHTDMAVLTILYQDDSPGGLQVLAPGGQWIDVPPVPGSFVVNLGQLMAIWTNDRWASTTHRVLNPQAEHAHRDRISIAFFCLPNADTLIECIPTCADADHPARHRPVTAGDYLIARSRRAYLASRAGGRAHE